MRMGLVHVCATWVRVVVVLQVGLLGAPALGCYQCLVDVGASLRLCWGHVLTRYNIRNVDSCFETIDRVFNNNEKVIEAGRVGEDRNHDCVLKLFFNAVFFYLPCFFTF